MPFHPSWDDIALRLLLTLVTGAIIGLDRGEHGRPVGLRTTLLVCLAASVSMILTNLLLDMSGKTSSSFAVADVMRLPLGILSGMGFIGAAAVIRRGDIVLGVTTTATLWFVTVMGLCFGGGAIWLGLIAFALGFLTLWGLKYVEQLTSVQHHATLLVEAKPGGPGRADVDALIGQAGMQAELWSVTHRDGNQMRSFRCVVRWRGKPGTAQPPDFLEELARRDGVATVSWSA